jgi:MoxR-like ATPase
MMPSQFRCSSHEDFIGPASKESRMIKRMVDLCKENGNAAIKLLILGAAGIGKTQLAEHFLRCTGSTKWSAYTFNGTGFKVDDCADLARTVHYKTPEYRTIVINEVDRVPPVAQVAMLSLLDDLPPHNAIVCTSNCGVKDLEPRFQSRFQVIQLASPSDDEITEFLSGRWKLTTTIARQIATFANGNVRQALLDAQSYLVA